MATGIADQLGAASPRIRVAVNEARDKLTVAERTSLVSAWVAAESASILSVLWRDQISAPVDAATTAAVTQLDTDLGKLLTAASAKDARANAVAVFDDARKLAVSFKLTATRATSMKLPAMNAASCKATLAAIEDDLGAISTSELLIGSTRPGYPWVTLAPVDAIEHIDTKRFIKPRWVRPTSPPSDAAKARTKLTKVFGNDATKAKPSLDEFDRGVKAGFSAKAALFIAEASPSDKTFALVTGGVKKQVNELAAAKAGPQDDVAVIGALFDGYSSGARARSIALAAGKNPGVVKNLASTHTAADKALPQRKRELLACMQLPGGDVDRDKTFRALAMIVAYMASAPGDPCPAGQGDCAPGQTCNSGVCVAWCGGCPTGETCTNAVCAMRDKPCQGVADCGDSNVWTCNAGMCAQKCGTTTCGSTQVCQCGPGETLQDGQCVRPSFSCGGGFVCPSGDVCVSGVCQRQCGATSCPNDQVCNANVCQPRPENCAPQKACTVCAQDQFCDGGQTPSCKSGPAEKTCTTDGECKPPPDVPSQASPRCVSVVTDTGAPAKMCIGIGWACNAADDCGPGNECDRAIGQCVDRETYNCNATNACRGTEQCLAQDLGPPRCGPQVATANAPCERNDKNGTLLQGECRKGTWQQDASSTWQCVTKASTRESCDRLDNDCNGVADDIQADQCTNAPANGICKTGTKYCSDGTEQCRPGPAQPESCDGQDNDCDGTADNNIMPTGCTADGATGECRNGTKVCGPCQPSQPNGEVCDGRDNNCDGTNDNLGTVHDASQHDGYFDVPGGLFGFSGNFLVGPKECGGTRASAAMTLNNGNHAWCGFVEWANNQCNDPNRRHEKVGNSDVTDACNAYLSDGPDNGANDCRYIVHIGISSTGFAQCTATHIVTVPDRCQ